MCNFRTRIGTMPGTKQVFNSINDLFVLDQLGIGMGTDSNLETGPRDDQ